MTSYRRNYNYKTPYNTSSVAYDLQTESEQRHEDFVRRNRQKKIRQKRLKKEEKKYFITVAIHRFKLIFSIFIVVFGSFIFINSGAQITRQTRNNRILNEKIIALQNENTALKAEISDKIDMDYIREEAVNRLHMSEPQDYQVAYIEVPKQSYTIQYETREAADEDESFSISALMELFKD